ncbi:DUF5672 family protein [Erythrobacter rubeus]|uniref:DUF5672 domain-containing protein n=1 Tax=Erythrobacter rubeus TaxID=2760803 RepID=A0ABR8KL42_9SPHN|nr:DUF5672 family protein [Erythrobacter rubeus]MBD2841030.1 hypothetical protein [Erythrobacter rubeus]
MSAKSLMSPIPSERLKLPEVTICAASSTNVEATILAIETSLAYVEPAEAILFTDVDVSQVGLPISDAIRVVRIEELRSSSAYSHFIVDELVKHIQSSHCLVVQWDGHIIDPDRWSSEFLEYDYIGASWPQFDDGRCVGNGGFSLRSRRLMEACLSPDFQSHHPEDIAICRTNRALLEKQGMRFGPADLADMFSAERASDPSRTFGYHGVFLMPEVLGPELFWELYLSLDERGSLKPDFRALRRAVNNGENGGRRSLRMLGDRVADMILPKR